MTGQVMSNLDEAVLRISFKSCHSEDIIKSGCRENISLTTEAL